MSYGTNDMAAGAFAITKSNVNDLSEVAYGLYVGGAGDIKITMINGDEITFVGVAAGTYMPVVVKKVWDTGTSATNMVGLTIK